MYLINSEITKLIEDKLLFIRPLLESSQINEVAIDLRLGTDFCVAIQGRYPFINASKNEKDYDFGDVANFFQETRRRIGETFILHPNQTILASTLEFIKLPNDVMAILSIRSTYARLGLSIHSVVQPGYSGCFSIELTNNNKSPINLTIGACLFQVRFAKVSSGQNYFNQERKYICQVRPVIPPISTDRDLNILNTIWAKDNAKNS